jgi:uncharacterized protein (TIGR00255 family)
MQRIVNRIQRKHCGIHIFADFKEILTVTSGQIQSMTGFAQSQVQFSLGSSAPTNQGLESPAPATVILSVELKSVNSRFLDLSFKAHDDLRAFESQLRDKITQKIKRGKLECRLSIKHPTQAGSAQQLNVIELQKILVLANTASEQAKATQHELAGYSALELLRWPGVIEQSSTALIEGDVATAISNELDLLMTQALELFCASRLREGVQTANVMLEHASGIEALVKGLEAELPAINAELQKRFKDKALERLNLEGLPDSQEIAGRINQELILLALRADVSEEINRLKSHLIELRKTLHGNGAVGKKLDFLLQEFNREANTLGSKAPSLEVSKVAIELKLLIEQIREQVQNLE